MRCGKYIPDPIVGTDAPLEDQGTITFKGAQKPLFNYCEDATLDNIHVSGNITLQADNYLNLNTTESGFGGICSAAKHTTFSFCSNTINLKHTSTSSSMQHHTGGIVGYADNCTIESCRNYGEIDSKFSNAYASTGGIVGFIQNGTIVDFCYNVGTLNGKSNIGGIVGQKNQSGNDIIKNCKNINAVHASVMGAGGILGTNYGANTIITDCFNSGTITAESYAGSIAAFESDNATITYCFNTGDITSSDNFSFAIAQQEEEEDGETMNCLSTGNPEIYISNTSDIIDKDNFLSSLNTEHFEQVSSDEIIHKKTQCNGSTWRLEEAGRLYKSDNTFYLAWDGKFDNGDCVTGEVTVNYQKNTGVTHFPFYDPENIKCNESGLNGLVVYRIRPEETGEHASTPINLPLNYYRTDETSSEKGVEMKLYWDDSKIFYTGACTKELNRGDSIGKTVQSPFDTVATGRKISYYDEDCDCEKEKDEYVPREYCINTKNCTKSTTKAWFYNPKTGKLEGSQKYYCTGPCGASTRYMVLGESTTQCQGIDNSKKGSGYPGSRTGHIFPIETNDTKGFGNKHIINTWWNGIEKAGVNTLNLRAYSPAEILPIIISKWMVTSLSESVLLEWTTSSEENNSHFIVERSINGKDWQRIGKVIGAGTSSVEHSYSFEDTKPIAGISYYRLKQTDFNGEYSYSSIKCINRPNETEDYMTVYPNANANSFIVEGISIAACPIEVYDIVGHKITNVSFNTINPSKVAISVEHLPIGTYIVTCCNKSKTIVKNW